MVSWISSINSTDVEHRDVWPFHRRGRLAAVGSVTTSSRGCLDCRTVSDGNIICFLNRQYISKLVDVPLLSELHIIFRKVFPSQTFLSVFCFLFLLDLWSLWSTFPTNLSSSELQTASNMGRFALSLGWEWCCFISPRFFWHKQMIRKYPNHLWTLSWWSRCSKDTTSMYPRMTWIPLNQGQRRTCKFPKA